MRDIEGKFYKQLKIKLQKTGRWPSEYLFKFIVTSDRDKIDMVKFIFSGISADITEKLSSKGSYTSISVLATFNSPDMVVDYYKEVSKIKGVISL